MLEYIETAFTDSREARLRATRKAAAYVVFGGVMLFLLQAYFNLMLLGRVTNTVADHSHFMYYSQYYLKIVSAMTAVALVVYYAANVISVCAEQSLDLRKFALNNLILIPLALMLLWAFIATMKSPNLQKSLYGSGYINEGFFTVLQYAVVFLSAYAVRKQVKFSKTAVVWTFIALAGLIEICLLCVEIFPITVPTAIKAGVFNNSNHFGYFLAMSATMTFGALVYSKNKATTIITSLLLLLNVYYLFVSNALGANLAYIGGIVFIVCSGAITKKLQWKKLLLALGLSAAITLLIEAVGRTNMWKSYIELLNDIKRVFSSGLGGEGEDASSSGTGRFGLWKRTIAVIKQVPWFGKGLDLYYANNIYDPTLDVAHNEYLTMASNVGIPGLILYLTAIVWWFVKAVKNRKRLAYTDLLLLASAFAYLISAAFGNSFTYTYPYFLLFFAMSIQGGKSYDGEDLKAEDTTKDEKEKLSLDDVGKDGEERSLVEAV
ncbi:MAG: O-antigen ligase family protein [Clostridia bacterium]|nr:O-antigen ligase family protein [Clostridia bacterium]MDE7328570.1 O-antigen ligase family protein [Clostridia bacterium]